VADFLQQKWLLPPGILPPTKGFPIPASQTDELWTQRRAEETANVTIF